MAFFKPQKISFYFFLILLLSVLSFQFLSIKQEKNFLFKGVYFISGGIQGIKHRLHFFLSETAQKYIFLLKTREENIKLRRQVLTLQARHGLFNELKAENNRLNEMIAFSQRENMRLLPAQVIAYDFLFQNQLIVINRGTVHGVHKYMGVIHPKGVIGHIFRVASHSSQIVTLMNKISSLPGLNQRSRIKGLAEPYNRNLLIFKYFDLQETHKTFQKGDKIVTSISEHFPTGLPVGTVVSMTEEVDNAKRNIFVEPEVSFSSVEELFVILNHNKEMQ